MTPSTPSTPSTRWTCQTRWTHHLTPLGRMLLAADDRGVVGAWFDGDKHVHGPDEAWHRDDGDALLAQVAAQLDDWFAGRRRGFDLPLAPRGTDFQQAVWREIARVGWGDTRSYGEVATAVGRPRAVRAVGAATGRNPLTLIVPCHRLLGRDGALTGFASGLDRKRALLAFEAGAPLLWRTQAPGQATLAEVVEGCA